MYLTIQGLVLRVTNYNDTDALLTVLTQDKGKLTLKARGLRRKNSPLTAPCQLLGFSSFTLFENRGYYTINEASVIELFHPLRKDLQKLSLATYFAQVADVMSQEDMPNPQLLSLLLNSLYALCKLPLPELQVKAVFELRIAVLGGYAPDLQACYYCQCENPDRFNLSQGHLECSRCSGNQDGIRLPICPGTLDAMRYIAYCDDKKLFAFSLGKEALEQLSQVTESYLATQLERGFSTLDFYKTLLI